MTDTRIVAIIIETCGFCGHVGGDVKRYGGVVSSLVICCESIEDCEAREDANTPAPLALVARELGLPSPWVRRDGSPVYFTFRIPCRTCREPVEILDDGREWKSWNFPRVFCNKECKMLASA